MENVGQFVAATLQFELDEDARVFACNGSLAA
ncbi:hypothetical protein PF005_g15535 [Phytophthora fragariae]|uniref:Uncharacterized protein n=1 Tax=Phytophthora fragariae TaxID=53985 RepID=A0A6A4D7P8_9STRA|nr:hypothetical protein PF003_g38286 [Phytophthora fragariae]KAE9199940.1 hypothetical protein PF005_g15535 [Phytophthora fragariae]KAE9301703.1 hypothetical protein PF001_g14333 [Phytophthora fragariae]